MLRSFLIDCTCYNHNVTTPVDKTASRSSTATQEDVELLHRIAERDELAVGQLYDRYASYLFALLLRILKEHVEAEDSLQEVFLRVWDRAETYNESLGNPVVWLTRLTRNLAIDKLRSKLTHQRKAEEELGKDDEVHESDAERNPLNNAQQTQQRAYINAALATLPHEQRVLIEYAYFQGFTQTELAEHFHVPLGTVKTRIRTGMISLRRQLEGFGFKSKGEQTLL